ASCRSSYDWNNFYRMIQRAYPKKGKNLTLPMPESEAPRGPHGFNALPVFIGEAGAILATRIEREPRCTYDLREQSAPLPRKLTRNGKTTEDHHGSLAARSEIHIPAAVEIARLRGGGDRFDRAWHRRECHHLFDGQQVRPAPGSGRQSRHADGSAH